MNLIALTPLSDPSTSEFRIVNNKGEDVETGDIGLLLYNGGTVCDDSFSDNSANAICRKMGQRRATKWQSGSYYYYEAFGNYAQQLDITLDNVDCRESNWDTCSYSTTHNCDHWEDVYLACYSGSILSILRSASICKICNILFFSRPPCL